MGPAVLNIVCNQCGYTIGLSLTSGKACRPHAA